MGRAIVSGDTTVLGRSLGAKLAANDGPSVGWTLGLGEGIELRRTVSSIEGRPERKELGETVVGRTVRIRGEYDGFGGGRVDG